MTDDVFDRVVLVTRHVEPVPGAAVDELIGELGMPLPSGYREFITRFGEGSYADLFRLYPPDRIRADLAEMRARWAEFWFFDQSADLLASHEAQEAVPIGDTFDGDELVVHPKRDDVVFILPRHVDRIATVASDLRSLHRWADREEPLTFQAWTHQDRLERSVREPRLDQATLLGRVRARWGGESGDGVIVGSSNADDGRWHLVLFVPSAGVRLQFVGNDGVTRTTTDARGTRITFMGEGRSSLAIQVYGDEEGLPEVLDFLAQLAADGLIEPIV
jgi:hypothetical protein